MSGYHRLTHAVLLSLTQPVDEDLSKQKRPKKLPRKPEVKAARGSKTAARTGNAATDRVGKTAATRQSRTVSVNAGTGRVSMSRVTRRRSVISVSLTPIDKKTSKASQIERTPSDISNSSVKEKSTSFPVQSDRSTDENSVPVEEYRPENHPIAQELSPLPLGGKQNTCTKSRGDKFKPPIPAEVKVKSAGRKRSAVAAVTPAKRVAPELDAEELGQGDSSLIFMTPETELHGQKNLGHTPLNTPRVALKRYQPMNITVTDCNEDESMELSVSEPPHSDSDTTPARSWCSVM